MIAAALALALAASPSQPGTYRKAARASDGVHVALFLYRPERPAPGAPLVVLSTAHPAKFPETVLAATGVEPLQPPLVRALNGRAERFERIAADVDAVKAVVHDVMGA